MPSSCPGVCCRWQRTLIQLQPHLQHQARASLVLWWWSCRRGVKSSIPLVNIRTIIKSLLKEGRNFGFSADARVDPREQIVQHFYIFPLFQMKVKMKVEMRMRMKTNGMTDFHVCVDFELISSVIFLVKPLWTHCSVWCRFNNWTLEYGFSMRQTV